MKGFVFFKDKLHQGSGFGFLIASFLDEWIRHGSLQNIVQALRNLNGQFAFVVLGENLVLAAVDRLRSIPLYYSQRGDHLFLSDDAHWVKDQMGDGELSIEACDEFLQAGYVIGSQTLYPYVKQFQAGEFLSWVILTEHREPLKIQNYYTFLRKDQNHDDFLNKEHDFDALAIKVFERFTRFLNGRTVMIPLSGGIDSRFIAIMLKRLDYQEVICFSYGAWGNRESAVSASVARRLGFPWYFIPYTRKLWHDYFWSDHKKAYFEYGAGLASLPCIQDWPAVGELKQRDLIPNNAVFAPGHKGFIYFNPMRGLIEACSEPDEEFMVGLILGNYYNLWNWSRAQEIHGPVFLRRIQDHMADSMISENAADLLATLEWWEFQERQAKFIFNSVRCYEYWGYDWYMPICDSEMLDFWLIIENKGWYAYFLKRWRHFGLSHTCPTKSVVLFFKSLLKPLIKTCKPVYSFKLELGRWHRRYLDYLGHKYRWYGIHGFGKHIAATSAFDSYRWARTSNINSILARNFLNELLKQEGLQKGLN